MMGTGVMTARIDQPRPPAAAVARMPETVRAKALVEVIREAIVEALVHSRGNISEAADILMIGRTTLYRKMKDLEITQAEFLDVRADRRPAGSASPFTSSVRQIA